MDLSPYRKDFPMLAKAMHGQPLIYLDSAATAQKPYCVIEAMRRFYEEEYGTVHRAVYALSVASTEHYSAARHLVARFINALSAEEIIFTKGTTESINLVASSFGKKFIDTGDEIVITELEHHSNIVPWQLMCQAYGAHLKVIPINNETDLILETLEETLTHKTKLVSLTHISNLTATVNPVAKIVQMAHAVGAKVLVDGAQAAQHISVDVQELGVDFYAFSGHKLYGPTGIGILYGKKDILDQMPPYQGGGDMIEHVTFQETTFNHLPLRFEAGTPNIAGALGLAAAIKYISSIGLANIQRHEQELVLYAVKELQKIKGLRIIGTPQERGSLISFTVDNIHPLDLGTLLDLKGIAIRTGHHCAQPTLNRLGLTQAARLSFGLYNTQSDVDVFVQALEEAFHSLQR